MLSFVHQYSIYIFHFPNELYKILYAIQMPKWKPSHNQWPNHKRENPDKTLSFELLNDFSYRILPDKEKEEK